MKRSSKTLQGTAETKEKCDEACCSSDGEHQCQEIYYRKSDKACVLFGSSGIDTGSFAPSGFTAVTEASELNHNPMDYQASQAGETSGQWICDEPVVARIL